MHRGMWLTDPPDDQNVAELLQTNPDFFLSFTLIIASGVKPQTELALAELLWKGKLQVNIADRQLANRSADLTSPSSPFAVLVSSAGSRFS